MIWIGSGRLLVPRCRLAKKILQPSQGDQRFLPYHTRMQFCCFETGDLWERNGLGDGCTGIEWKEWYKSRYKLSTTLLSSRQKCSNYCTLAHYKYMWGAGGRGEFNVSIGAKLALCTHVIRVIRDVALHIYGNRLIELRCEWSKRYRASWIGWMHHLWRIMVVGDAHLDTYKDNRRRNSLLRARSINIGNTKIKQESPYIKHHNNTTD